MLCHFGFVECFDAQTFSELGFSQVGCFVACLPKSISSTKAIVSGVDTKPNRRVGWLYVLLALACLDVT